MDGVDGFFIFLIGLMVGVLMTAAVLGLQHDESDVINTKLLGEKMCAEKGLTYSHREITYENTPKIYCMKETKLEDGYLVLMEGGN